MTRTIPTMLLLLLAAVAAALLSGCTSEMPKSSDIALGEAEKLFYWTDFCERHKEPVCSEKPTHSIIEASQKNLDKLQSVNREVNHEISFYGVGSFGDSYKWDYPMNGEGNCVSFSLEKRRRLVAAGFPQNALKLARVVVNGGWAHMVLTAWTDKGVYVLDNRYEGIVAWKSLPYVWVSVQNVGTLDWNIVSE